MNNIKSFLKKFPLFYRSFQKIYYTCWWVIETYILGTKMQEWIWRTKHVWNDKGWAKGYCETIKHPHRQFLIGKIMFYTPFESVLEIGCNTGPNLYLIAKNSQKIKLYGIDINHRAIKEGKEWLEKVGFRNVILLVGKADELEGFDDKSIDVVFTDATLLYIGPDKIERVIRSMLRIARKSLVFNEWHRGDSLKNKEYFFYDGHWVYNYKSLLVRYVSPDSIKITKIPKGLWGDSSWDEFGSIIEVRL